MTAYGGTKRGQVELGSDERSWFPSTRPQLRLLVAGPLFLCHLSVEDLMMEDAASDELAIELHSTRFAAGSWWPRPTIWFRQVMYCVFSVARSLISSVRVALRDTSLLKLERPICPWIFAKRLRQSTPFRKEEGRNRERELVEVVPVSFESQSNLSAVATKMKIKKNTLKLWMSETWNLIGYRW